MNRLPLSLLDLLACGFGGVILLFFVTIVVWEEMAGDTTAFSMDSATGNSLFILLVTPEDSDELLFEDLSDVVWKAEGGLSSTQWKQDITPKYAVFYTHALPARTKLTLSGVRSDIQVVGRIFHSGKTSDFSMTSNENSLYFNESILKK